VSIFILSVPIGDRTPTLLTWSERLEIQQITSRMFLYKALSRLKCQNFTCSRNVSISTILTVMNIVTPGHKNVFIAHFTYFPDKFKVVSKNNIHTRLNIYIWFAVPLYIIRNSVPFYDTKILV